MGNEQPRAPEPSHTEATDSPPSQRVPLDIAALNAPPRRHLCHNCQSTGNPVMTASGEYLCVNCQGEGFVEILDGTEELDGNLVILHQALHNQEMVNSLFRLFGRGAQVRSSHDDFVSTLLQQLVTLQSTLEEQQNQGTPPGSSKALEELRNKAITVEENSPWLKESCVICQSNYEVSDKIAILNVEVQTCQHPYHLDCIISWLERHNSCPVCRYELPTDDDAYEVQRLQRNSDLLGHRRT